MLSVIEMIVFNLLLRVVLERKQKLISNFFSKRSAVFLLQSFILLENLVPHAYMLSRVREVWAIVFFISFSILMNTDNKGVCAIILFFIISIRRCRFRYFLGKKIISKLIA